ncbi:MAG: DUF4386 domain-containing protein [Acidimicrobiales bacterium]
MTATVSPAAAARTGSAAHGTPAAAHDDRARLGALVAGVGYVALFVFAIAGNFGVVEQLVVDGDAAATTANLEGSLGWARFGFVAFTVIFLADLFVAWGLHLWFRRWNTDVSLLAAWSRVAYTVLLGVGLVHYAEALRLLGATGAAGHDGRSDVEVAVADAMARFQDAWLIGLAVFGVHLVVLAILMLRHRAAPTAMGWLIGIAGTAYVADTVAHIVLADYDRIATVALAIVAVPSMLGEGWLGLHLLRRSRTPHPSPKPQAV